MIIEKEIVTCPACDARYFGAINRADRFARDVRCPRCRNRFSVDGFMGRLSDALNRTGIDLGPRTHAATNTARIWNSR